MRQMGVKWKLWRQSLVPSLTNCVTLSKLLNPSEPWFCENEIIHLHGVVVKILKPECPPSIQ